MKLGPLTITRNALNPPSPGFKPEIPAQRAPLMEEIGAPGTLIFGGWMTQQDYNSDLTAPACYDIYDRMRLADGQVRAGLNVVKLPLLRAYWQVKPGSDSAQDKMIAEFVDCDLQNMTTSYISFLRQALLMLDYGSMPFEPCWEMRDDGLIHLRKLAPRLPKTIYRWLTDENGGFAGVQQLAYKASGAEIVDIPREKMLVFVNEQEGANMRGISMLRAAYKHWYFKDGLYKVDAIAKEKRSVGVDVGTIKPSAANKDDIKEALSRSLMTLHAHEKQYFIEDEENFTYRLETGSARIADAMGSIEHHDLRILRSILAEFLAMGSGSTGSLAMHKDKCLAAGTRVQMADGQRVPIERIEAGDRVVALGDDWKLHTDTVARVASSGRQEVFGIRTRSGRVIRATAEHRLRGFPNWKRVYELRVGDVLAVPRRLPIAGSNDLPDDEVKLMGHWLAEGHSYLGTLGITTSGAAVREELIGMADTYGWKIRETVRNGCSMLAFSGSGPWANRPAHLIRKHFGITERGNRSRFTSFTKHVPPAFFSLSERQTALFLNRLYSGDGHIGRMEVRYTTVSEQLARDVQTLLLRLGIRSRVAQYQTKGQGGFVGTAWRVIIQDGAGITRFCTVVGALGKDMNAAISQWADKPSYPKVDLIPEGWGKSPGTQAMRRRHRIEVNPSGNVSREKLARVAVLEKDDQMLALAQSDVLWDRIEAIESLGVTDTYDIETEVHHNFIADNVVSHNSAFFLMALEAIADNIAQTMSAHLLKRWVDYNWQVKEYPRIEYSRLDTREAGVIANAVNQLMAVGAITATPGTEAELRVILDLPEKDQAQGGVEDPPPDEQTAKIAEVVKPIQQRQMARLKVELAKGKAIEDIDVPYRKEMAAAIAEITGESVQARMLANLFADRLKAAVALGEEPTCEAGMIDLGLKAVA